MTNPYSRVKSSIGISVVWHLYMFLCMVHENIMSKMDVHNSICSLCTRSFHACSGMICTVCAPSKHKIKALHGGDDYEQVTKKFSYRKQVHVRIEPNQTGTTSRHAHTIPTSCAIGHRSVQRIIITSQHTKIYSSDRACGHACSSSPKTTQLHNSEYETTWNISFAT